MISSMERMAPHGRPNSCPPCQASSSGMLAKKGFERRGDMRHVGLNGGWTLVFFIQEILRQAVCVHPFCQVAQARRA